ncbi:coenzyme F420-0 gamma-glutamyl ligase [Sphingomonas laterariae]|uniref:Coenzyme F420-0 gamma-glutamyl ligase n=1 Tax=Edaphosphingomonas laterariae TaxID=861865 RepID=A0A239D2Z1_9SPHN|nr:coenzyme F420-0:L-glutamate ligase [Sphingomonas laterariae]SNS26775.1 coenzyme F420-0 gamma-glutamyl ligase [Sphingomonas laterariae]
MATPARELLIRAVPGVPMVAAGDELAAIVADALDAADMRLAPGDVLVIAQKVVSKAEGRLVRLAEVTPSAEAEKLAVEVDKDPRLVELILRETDEVSRTRPGALIVRDKRGLMLANAGIDQSNVDHAGGEVALLLPIDPDASARAIAEGVAAHTGIAPAVVIVDSLGRAWRMGTVGTAIGVHGLPGLLDLRGQADLHGRALQTSELGFADEVAAAGSLLMGQAAEGCPVVLIRGMAPMAERGTARDLVRPAHMDLFR